MSKFNSFLLVSSVLILSNPAVAAVSQAVQDKQAETIADQTLVGGIVILSAATAMAIRWVKATFF